ncbi:MAG TPA: BadF/BadG/BcrA/BcrD ATPase family protein [Bryobacteraceae bacterium]|nr:BadF/BadG/BcrA/BcrD ATPase family protein [Bryobacteraceae bacterium]
MSEYFLGVDGGQTSTVAVIGDESGGIAGWATAGPCNHVGASEGRAKFLRVMKQCLSQAAARAGFDAGTRPHFKAACLGMSGGPDDKAALLAELIDADRLNVTHDAKIALAGALEGEPGIIVIAGTGSIAYGENAHGEAARAGGWGYIYGDEGGGFDIARQAVRSVLREHEGWGPRTALSPAVIELTGATDANDALHRLYTTEWPRSRVAEMAMAVDRIASEGDPIAADILRQAAQQLALLAASVRRQLWGEGAVRIAHVGGVFQSEILLDRFRTLILLDGEAETEAPRHGPAAGALILAYRLAGLETMPHALTEIRN